MKTLATHRAQSLRQLRRPLAADIAIQHTAYIARLDSFVVDVLSRKIDEVLQWPLWTNHARLITALGMFEKLEVYYTAMLHNPKDTVQLSTTEGSREWLGAERVEYLLAGFASNYTDVRAACKKM